MVTHRIGIARSQTAIFCLEDFIASDCIFTVFLNRHLNRSSGTRKIVLLGVIFLNIMLIYSCAGTIQTVRQSQQPILDIKKAYIISADNSQFIKFRFGIITPYAYISLPDKPAQKHEKIGNTELVIKQELEKHGIKADIGKEGDIPDNIDLKL